MKILALVVSVFVACGVALAQPKDTDITAKQLDLGLSMLAQGAPGAANSVLSPYSIHSALMLLRLGAEGETAAELDKRLLPSSFSSDLRSVYRSLNEAIVTSRDSTTVALANSLWLRNGYQFRESYLTASREVLSAEPRHVNYGQPEGARKTINAWVSSKTNSLISNLLPPGALTKDTTCALVNALYFKSPWVAPFKKERTKDESFWVSPTSEAKVPMMSRSDSMGYFENDQWQAAHLSYQAYDYLFVVLVPKERMSAERIAREVSVSLFSQAMEEQQFTKVNLSLPRFKVRQNRDLIAQLNAYGLSRLAGGDYSGISPQGVGSVGSILHEAVVTVDESGTEAAAATAVVMARGAFIREENKPKEVRADRPFAFAIIHRPSKAPLFLGVVGDPR